MTHHSRVRDGLPGRVRQAAHPEEDQRQETDLAANVLHELGPGQPAVERLAQAEGEGGDDGHALLHGEFDEAQAGLEVQDALLVVLHEGHFLHATGAQDGGHAATQERHDVVLRKSIGGGGRGSGQ